MFLPARLCMVRPFSCCPFSGGALIPLLRSPSSSSDGPSGEAAGMEANKRRLTPDLTSTFQRLLKVWRSRASACAGAVKPPSTGRPTKGEADTPLLGSPMRHSQHALGAPSGRYAVRPRLRARGFSRRAGRSPKVRVVKVQPVFQTARHAPAQLVAAELQTYQVGEAAQLRRYLPAQLVAVEAQRVKVGEAAQLRRYLPAQGVARRGPASQVWRLAAQLRRVSPRSTC